ncbi:unnamed protein product, partial [Cladocopium goreaui]
DGCGIFLRKTLRATQSHSFRLRDVAERHFPDAANLRGGAGFAAALWRELHEKLTLANAVEVSVESGRKVWISTCHLYWDPRYPDLKLLQAWLLERELSALSGGKPLILAGDLNSTPLLDGRSQGPKGAELSGVYELMTRGRVDVQHPHHPVLLRPGTGILAGVRPQDVPEFQVESFQSAAQEAGGEVTTNISADFRGCLDYIFYRGDGLRLLKTKWPQADALSLPSEDHPSDHLPLLAEFELSEDRDEKDAWERCWPRIEAQVPEIAALQLEPSLLPAILGFFTYTVGKDPKNFSKAFSGHPRSDACCRQCKPRPPWHSQHSRRGGLQGSPPLMSPLAPEDWWASRDPRGKVIDMLKDMELQGEKEKKAEAVQFAAYQQFCEKTEVEKKRIIADSKDKVEVLTAEIEKSGSDAEKLAEEIAGHLAEVESVTAEKEAASKVRETERKDFQAMLKDYTESVDAIGRALKVLKAQAAPALVQLKSLELPEHASRGLNALLSEGSEEQLGEPSYEFQSGGVVAMLQKLEDKFLEERLQLEKAPRAPVAWRFPTGGGRWMCQAHLLPPCLRHPEILLAVGISLHGLPEMPPQPEVPVDTCEAEYEIALLQSDSSITCCLKSPFSAEVKELLKTHSKDFPRADGEEPVDLKISRPALYLLQRAVESYGVQLMHKVNLLAKHRKAQTVELRDLRALLALEAAHEGMVTPASSSCCGLKKARKS